jgi:hypothetical protein
MKGRNRTAQSQEAISAGLEGAETLHPDRAATAVAYPLLCFRGGSERPDDTPLVGAVTSFRP